MAKKFALEKEEVLWKDRRRRFGLPLSFTRYAVEGGRLMLRSGFFKTVTDELLIYRILDIRLERTLGQKLFGVGTVTVLSTDKSTPSLQLKNIKHPEEVRCFFGKLIEEERAKYGVFAGEMAGGHDYHGNENNF